MKLHRFFSATALLLATGIPATYASIQINTTRVIYHAAEKDISVQITNPGKYPVLLQSWSPRISTESAFSSKGCFACGVSTMRPTTRRCILTVTNLRV